MQQYFETRIFLVFYYNILYCFCTSGEKYAKVIDDDICNGKVEFKPKGETMKMNRNYKNVERKFDLYNF